MNTDLVRAIGTLPPLPFLVHEILLATTNDDAALTGIATKVAQEPGISARVVALANAAYSGGFRPVYSIEGAIVRLGLNRVRMLAASAALAQQFDTARCPGFDPARYWYHAVGTASCAAQVGRACKHAGDAAYLAGLLHNIGVLLLAWAMPQPMSVLLAERARDPQRPLAPMLRERLGTDHFAAGRLLLEKWGLPADIVAAAGSDPTQRPPAAHTELVRLVQFCAQWTAAGFDEPPPDHGLPADPQQLAAIGAACRNEREHLTAFAQLLTQA